MSPQISWDEGQAFSDWGIKVSHIGAWSESLDLGTGQRSSSATTSVVDAVRSHVRRQGVTQSGVVISVGDRWYRVRANAVSPAIDQHFTDASVSYRVLDWETTSDGLIHKILTRRV